MSAEGVTESGLVVECGRCEVPHAAGPCSSLPPRSEKDLIERLEDRLARAEARLDHLEQDRSPLDERELGEAAHG